MKVAWDSYFWQLAGEQGVAVTVWSISHAWRYVPLALSLRQLTHVVLLTCTVARGP